jgi:hypothetical protein
MEEEVTISTMPYIDDDLTPLALKAVNQLHNLLSLYDEYTGIIGLNINTSKTTALCINIPALLCEH